MDEPIGGVSGARLVVEIDPPTGVVAEVMVHESVSSLCHVSELTNAIHSTWSRELSSRSREAQASDVVVQY